MTTIPLLTPIEAGRSIPDDYTDWEITGFRDVRVLDIRDQQVRIFAVPVAGDSLINKHICPGDVLICRVTSRYEDGRIGIWQTPSGRTAKYAYFDSPDDVVLHNENGWQQRWAASDIRLIGIVERIERDDV